LVFSHCATPEKRYHVSREEAGGKSGLLHKEQKMSREDDLFGDFDESSNDVDTGQEDTSEPLMDESTDETEAEPVFEEPPRPASPRPKPKAKKKAITKPKPKPKPKAAKKKTSKTKPKPAAKTKTKKKAPATKKKAPAAKKKAARAKPKK
jgi:outer membrane biosynthesis protein TonB